MSLADQDRGSPGKGYWVNFSPNEEESVHDFCGDHGIAGAECPSCHKPLLRLMTLFTEDSRLEIDPAITPAVHLLYCWTCSIPYGNFSYRIATDGSVEVLEAMKDDPYEFGAEGPYENYPAAFPHRRIGLAAQTFEEDDLLARVANGNDEDEAPAWLEPKHQIGGVPFIYNRNPSIACFTCHEDTPLLAAICDDATGAGLLYTPNNRSLTGNSDVQMIFHYCRKCSVVVAYHSND